MTPNGTDFSCFLYVLPSSLLIVTAVALDAGSQVEAGSFNLVLQLEQGFVLVHDPAEYNKIGYLIQHMLNVCGPSPVSPGRLVLSVFIKSLQTLQTITQILTT